MGRISLYLVWQDVVRVSRTISPLESVGYRGMLHPVTPRLSQFNDMNCILCNVVPRVHLKASKASNIWVHNFDRRDDWTVIAPKVLKTQGL
jgi:hypothetical protein